MRRPRVRLPGWIAGVLLIATGVPVAIVRWPGSDPGAVTVRARGPGDEVMIASPPARRVPACPVRWVLSWSGAG
jgi:hypothetical protein